ncbi:MAG: hypothetical protein ACR2GA_01840 [Chloroflexota bacterium]
MEKLAGPSLVILDRFNKMCNTGTQLNVGGIHDSTRKTSPRFFTNPRQIQRAPKALIQPSTGC